MEPGIFIPRSSQDRIRNAAGEDLLRFCRENDAFILNGRTASDPSGSFTYHHSNGASVIDYALVSSQLFFHDEIDMSVLPTDFTEHSALSLILPLVRPSPAVVEPGERKQLPPRIVVTTDEEKGVIDERFARHSDHFYFRLNHALTEGDYNDAAISVAELIRLVALPIIKKSRKIINSFSPWFTPSCRKKKRKVKTAWKKYSRTGLTHDLTMFSAARRDYRRALSKAKKTFFDRKREELESAVKKKDLSSLWKQIKSGQGKYTQNESCSITPRDWSAHFNRVMNHPTLSRDEWNVDPASLSSIPELDNKISVVEVFEAIKEIKTGKAPGIDGVSGSILKHLGDRISERLTLVFNHLLENGVWPQVWTQALLVPIYKGTGSKSSPDCYRGIALLSQIGKIFARIIYKRLSAWVESNNIIHDTQGGFRKNHETLDNILIIDTLVEDALSKPKGRLYICTIDKRKAFDFCSRSAVLKRLAECGISRKMFLLFKAMFNESTFGVRVSENESSKFIQSTSGIFQGCIISPFLFIMFLNNLSDVLNNNSEGDAPMLHTRLISHLLWADDLCIISRSVQGLQSQITCLENFCDYWGIEINLQKTKIVVCKRGGRISAAERWTMKGETIEVSPGAKYLGILLAGSHSYSKHKSLAVSKGMRALFSLSKFYFRNKNLPVKTFLQLFHSLIQPVVLYGSEIWGVLFRKSEMICGEGSINWSSDLDKPAVRFAKLIMGLPRGAPNSSTLLDLGLTRSHAVAFSRAISYWNRISRKTEGSIMRDCLTHQVNMINDGKKPWLLYIKNILERTGLGEYFERESSTFHPKILLSNFKDKINCICRSDLLNEARNLRSLQHYVTIFEPRKEVQAYVNTKFETRRLIAMTRFNLKYSLPFDHTERCKFCSVSCDTDERWNHILFNCTLLPPLPELNETSSTPYPYCVSSLCCALMQRQYFDRDAEEFAPSDRLRYACGFNW